MVLHLVRKQFSCLLLWHEYLLLVCNGVSPETAFLKWFLLSPLAFFSFSGVYTSAEVF